MKKGVSILVSLLMILTSLFICPPLSGEATIDQAHPAQVVITEVCFNPAFPENKFGIEKNADVLEFIEIYNRSDAALDLSGWTAAYAKNGYDDTFATCPLIQHLPEGGYLLGAGETAVLAIVTAQVTQAAQAYATVEEFAALHAFFCELNNCADRLPVQNFYVLPTVESGTETAIEGRFNLGNSVTNAVIALRDASGATVCEANYDASYWNRNNYALNLMYTGTVPQHPLASEPFNVSNPTPGFLFENQIPADTAGLTAPVDQPTLRVKMMEYNVCATDEQGEGKITQERAQEVFKVINRHDPDILCLCEVNYMWLPFLNETLVGEGNAYAVSGRSSSGAKYERPQRNTWDLYNLILWKTDTYTLVDSGNFWCSSTPKRPTNRWEDGTVGDFNRCINWVILEEKETGAQFFVLCQHIDAKVPVARLYSTQLISKQATELSKGLPVLMTGDWNANDGSEAYWALMESGQFADARYRTSSPSDMTLYGSFNKWGGNDNLQSRAPIDHCILSRDMVFVNSVHVDEGHYGDENQTLFAADHNATIYTLDMVIKTNTPPTPETTPETEAPTEPETQAPTTEPSTESPAPSTEAPVTSAPVTDAPAQETDDVTTPASTGGCQSSLALSALAVLALCIWPLRKRKQ